MFSLRSCAHAIGGAILGMTLLAAASGCDSAPIEQPVAGPYRLVDPSERSQMIINYGARPPGATAPVTAAGVGTADIPTATILDETRYVLGAPAYVLLLMKSELAVSANGRLELDLPIPAVVADAPELLLQPFVRRKDTLRHLPSQRLRRRLTGDTNRRSTTLEHLEEFADTNVAVHVYAHALDWGDNVSYHSRQLAIPRHARLEFGYGVLEPAWQSGMVTFTVDACEADRCERLHKAMLDPRRAGDRGWHDTSISLDQYAEAKVSLHFVSRQEKAAPDSFSMPVWSNPTVYVPKRTSEASQNVILLSLDTLAAGHLSTYGYEHETSPFLDQRFGLGGTVFEHCMAAATSTSPSHMTIFTGLDPSVHGVLTGLERLAPWIYPLGEPLRAAGIETGAVTEDGWLGARHGFGRGFNVYAENKSPPLAAPTGQIEATFERAERWISRHADRPFFLFLHTFQVHTPYAPPLDLSDLFTTQAGAEITADSPLHLRERVAYDQEIRFTDHNVALLFDALERNNALDNTVFILLSDHGEAFAEHGLLQHSTILYQEVNHVPLMVTGPGFPAGLRISAMVGHADIAPTILDLFGIEPPHEMSGRSLLPLVDEPEQEDTRLYIAEAWSRMSQDVNHRTSHVLRPSFAARRGSVKLIRNKEHDGFSFEQYDLSADPKERDNLLAGGAAPDGELHAVLDAHEQRSRVHRERLRTTGNQSATPAEPEKRSLDPTQEQKLRALGYLE